MFVHVQVTSANTLTDDKHSGAVADAAGDGRDFADSRPYRELWAAVILEQVKLATGKGQKWFTSELEVHAARRWFSTSNFRYVCSLAGVEPDYIRRGVNRQLAALGMDPV